MKEIDHYDPKLTRKSTHSLTICLGCFVTVRDLHTRKQGVGVGVGIGHKLASKFAKMMNQLTSEHPSLFHNSQCKLPLDKTSPQDGVNFNINSF